MRVKHSLIAAAWFVAALGGRTTDTYASVVRRLDPVSLSEGAEVVVEGRVTQLKTRWNLAHTGFETVVDVAVSDRRKGEVGTTIQIVQPGGTLNGARHVIVGMPVFSVGQDARFYLRVNANLLQGVSTSYRVYGWQQGVWPAAMERGSKVYRQVEETAQAPRIEGTAAHYTFNGMLWEPEQIPVKFLVHSQGSDDLPVSEAKEAVLAAFDTWQDVACSSLTYEFAGDTELGIAVDDANVILWIESEWIYGMEAAGATSLFFFPGASPTADVAFNGENYTWDVGPISTGTAVQDVQGVLTHELGHFSGLSHTMSSLDTMYFSWTPWESQRPLSADDKLGLCALYPQSGDECLGGQCQPGAVCSSFARGTLCSPQPDSIGDSCDYNRIECKDFCLFTKADLSSGYCSRFCDTDLDCPGGFSCMPASAGNETISACFLDPTRQVDAGPGAPTCETAAECSSGYYCNEAQNCARECIKAIDCMGTDTCNSSGQCISESSGCGCSSTTGSSSGLALFLLLLWHRQGRLSKRDLSLMTRSG